ncbi:hypothetical protein [Streptomyces sp. NPDC048248]|uniref:hypothetical protein n=1 Tax=Streptomyces sp. NPDC048248 TaxID=3365523 RepID=UPI0037220C38
MTDRPRASLASVRAPGVLSRSTGAASQLAPTALLTDPRSPRDLVDTLHRAPGRRRTHMTRLAGLLDDPSPAAWAHRIITAIRQA